jgi:hypothetical protein
MFVVLPVKNTTLVKHRIVPSMCAPVLISTGPATYDDDDDDDDAGDDVLNTQPILTTELFFMERNDTGVVESRCPTCQKTFAACTPPKRRTFAFELSESMPLV